MGAMSGGAVSGAGLLAGESTAPSCRALPKNKAENYKYLAHECSLSGNQSTFAMRTLIDCTTGAAELLARAEPAVSRLTPSTWRNTRIRLPPRIFLNIVRAVAAIEQSLCDLGQIGGGVHALRRRAAYAVEVRAQAHVIDSGDFGDVVDVVDQRLERRTRNFRHPLALMRSIST
jgi:hypothetical protein